MTARLYLDACMIIDLVEGQAEQQAQLAGALAGMHVVSSELARLERRIGALRLGQAAYLNTYRQFFDRCEMVSLDRAVFDLATDLRVQHGLKTPDALHLAAALHGTCDELWTNDRRLAVAAQNRIGITTWDDLAGRAIQTGAAPGEAPPRQEPDGTPPADPAD